MKPCGFAAAVEDAMKTIIAVPDFTREAHLKSMLPPILKKLKDDGVASKDIEIIIATGLHHPPTKKEIRHNLGSIADRFNVSVHNYRKNSVAYFGMTKRGIPLYLNKRLKKAASILTVGVVEPHLYAGYSGGTKVVAIGLAGEETINATHHPRFLDRPGTRICSVEKNPFRDFIDEASSLVPIRYSVNIINDLNGNLLKLFSGTPKGSFNKAIDYSKKAFEKKLKNAYDAIICDIPKEKSLSIYQASRAFNYVANTARPALKRRSVILVNADLRDGFGKGLGERRFRRRLSSMNTPLSLIKDIKKRGCLAGEHRAYMIGKALIRASLGFITKNSHLYKNMSLPFLFFKDLKEAQEFLEKYFGKRPAIYYLRNAFNTILVR